MIRIFILLINSGLIALAILVYFSEKSLAFVANQGYFPTSLIVKKNRSNAVRGTIFSRTPLRVSKTPDTDTEHLGNLKDNITVGHSSIRNNNVRSKQNQKEFTIDLRSYEEKEKKELEWLVHTTSNFIPIMSLEQPGEKSSEEKQSMGSLSQALVHRAFLLMKAWSRRGDHPHVVELILKRLIEERDAGNPHVELKTKVYNTMLYAWSKSEDPGATERAEEILEEMEKQVKNGNSDVQPTVQSYNSVIKSIVKNKKMRDQSVDKIQDIISRMRDTTLQQAQQRNDNSGHYNKDKMIPPFLPNRRSYNILLYAIANSNSVDAAEKAEEILRMMQKEYDEGNKYVRPDINSYNQVIVCWSRGRVQGYEERMQSLFDELIALPEECNVQPTVDTFNHMLGGYLKSEKTDAFHRTQETLSIMDECYQKGNDAAKPNRVTINTVLAAHARNGGNVNGSHDEDILTLTERLEKKYNVEPDATAFNILLSQKKNSSDFVENILENMETDFKSGKANRKPDVYTYSSAIDCFAKAGGEAAAIKGQEILARMRDLFENHGGDPANTHIYNALINAWASSGSKYAGSRAYDILQDMEKNHENDPFVPPPNIISVNTVLKAFCGSPDGGIKAEALLIELEGKGNFENLEPDAYSYCTAITATGRSNLKDKAEKAYNILERMIGAFQNGNARARPTIHAFNACLSACAFVNGDSDRKLEAFSTAVKVIMLLNQYASSNHVTYGLILRSASTLLPPGDLRREQLVESVFRKACNKGQVGQMVLKQMKFAASAELYQKLLGRNIDDRISLNELPSSWSCNVREVPRTRKCHGESTVQS